MNRQHLYPTATIQLHLANDRLPQQEKISVKFQFLEQIRLKTLQLFVPNSKRLGGYTQWVHFFFKKTHITQKTSSRQQFSNNIRFKTLHLFVPNSKRLGGYTQWVHFFLWKKRTSPRRLLQDKTTSRNHDKKKPDRAISEFFLIKNPSTCSGTFQWRIKAISRQDPPTPCTK